MSCPQIDFTRGEGEKKEGKKKKGKEREAKALQVGESLAPVQLGTEGPLIRGVLSQLQCCRGRLLLFAVETGGGGRGGGCRNLGKTTPASPSQKHCPSCCLAHAGAPRTPIFTLQFAGASQNVHPSPIPQLHPTEGSDCSLIVLPLPFASPLIVAFSL